MLLAHRIRLAPTPAQRDYFVRAAGTARRVWNWALAEWNRQVAAGMKPNAMALKRQFNSIKYSDPDWQDADGQPWLRTIHRDAHAQPFANLAKAWTHYFKQRRAGQHAHRPRFKKKGRCRDAFYLANDKFRLEGMVAVLSKVGRVLLCEHLRWPGKIIGASVGRCADHWYLSVQVDVPDHVAHLRRMADGVTGVDLGVSAAATLSNGEKITAPRPLAAALRRLRIRSRRLSRKLETAKANAGIKGQIPKGTRLPVSKNQTCGTRALARLHARIARVRADFMHKLTARLCRENQAVVIEDLNVRGMLANARLARAISDIGFYEFRRQLQYKAVRYGTQLVLADRWYPSSKLCSACGAKYSALGLGERVWACTTCDAHHDRDVNAAINLQRLATGVLAAQSALPVASSAVTPGTAAGNGPAGGGKVTPARHEHGQQDGSGQEENGVHLCPPS
ncbi:transposase [Massilia sp. Root133]|uniref:RNA-guided endonuclease InsQ/TnpB family protein n=1 Tax=unclassified Massilia TaxID=2609279 RepID=UPI0006FCC485|nr:MULTISPECIES: RNA-guided endonuclease TnpB family protein [unclassified Massilia]KQY05621.1 transposase [Massilia sp. Root133]KQZ52079.1 transposase [Massilia sp. Root1485]